MFTLVTDTWNPESGGIKEKKTFGDFVNATEPGSDGFLPRLELFTSKTNL